MSQSRSLKPSDLFDEVTKFSPFRVIKDMMSPPETKEKMTPARTNASVGTLIIVFIIIALIIYAYIVMFQLMMKRGYQLTSGMRIAIIVTFFFTGPIVPLILLVTNTKEKSPRRD